MVLSIKNLMSERLKTLLKPSFVKKIHVEPSLIVLSRFACGQDLMTSGRDSGLRLEGNEHLIRSKSVLHQWILK